MHIRPFFSLPQQLHPSLLGSWPARPDEYAIQLMSAPCLRQINFVKGIDLSENEIWEARRRFQQAIQERAGMHYRHHI